MKITHKMTTTDKLREILRVKNLKQKDLAGKLGVSEKTMSFWLNGKKKPNQSNVTEIDTMFSSLYDGSLVSEEVQVAIQNYQIKTEQSEEEKSFTIVEQTYYNAKCYVKEMEKENRRYIYLFPSMGKVADAWYKVGGNSLLFYKTMLAPRLKREARLRDDTDKAYTFKKGVASVKWGNRLMAEAEELGYKGSRVKYGIIVIDLLKDYTDAEIKGMVDALQEERNKLKKMIKPKNNYPNIMMAMNALARVLPSKVKKLDGAYREIMGKELMEPMVELFKIYFRFANGRMEKQDARLEMLERVDDLSAVMYLMDESNMLNITARTMMGENIVKIRNSIEESF